MNNKHANQSYQLYQLPNGNWIDAKDVKSIIAHPKSSSRAIEVDISASVIVEGYSKESFSEPKCRFYQRIEFGSYEQACAVRDVIAADVNKIKLQVHQSKQSWTTKVFEWFATFSNNWVTK